VAAPSQPRRRTPPPGGSPGENARPGARSVGAPSARFHPAVAAAVVLAAVLAATIVHAVVFGPGNAAAPKLTPASATVLQAIRGVTPAEQDAVGLPASVAVPLVAKGEPALRL
jgi:hypothetical protein